MNKGRSGRRITTRKQENIEVVWQALERNQGRISAIRNRLGILPSLFCQITKDGDVTMRDVPFFVSGFSISATIED